MVLELLDSIGARLHRLVYRLTLCEDATGDLMQQLFLNLSNSSTLERAKDPAAYAFRSAINLAFDWRRKNKIKFQSLDEDLLPVRNNPSALDKIIQQEQMQQVLTAIEKLGDLQRDVLVMRYIEQEPYETIAFRLGKKPQYLRSLCSKALAQMRSLLNSQPTCSSPRG